MDKTLIMCLIAFLIGMLVDDIIHRLQKSYGILRIDRSNQDKDTYRFEIDNLDELAHKKFVVLKIDNHADLSQK